MLFANSGRAMRAPTVIEKQKQHPTPCGKQKRTAERSAVLNDVILFFVKRDQPCVFSSVGSSSPPRSRTRTPFSNLPSKVLPDAKR